MCRSNRLGDVVHRAIAPACVFFGSLALAVWVCGCASPAPSSPGRPSDQPSDTTPPDDSFDTVAREIEEADIVKLQNGYFYLANRWTGLRLIDARTIERPVMAGHAPTQGRAVELFVRDDHAFVLSSADFFYCAGQPLAFRNDASLAAVVTPEFEGSRITVVDVADKQAPTIVAEFDLDGFVSATRRVGEVIYAAGNFPADYRLPEDPPEAGTNGAVGTNGTVSTNGSPVEDDEDDVIGPQFGLPQAFVVSINVADPDQPRLVDRAVFFGESFEINVSTQNTMFVAGADPTMLDTTLVTYVDISDPQGDIRLRNQFRVPGLIRNRYFMDEYEGVFRIMAEEFPRVFPVVSAAALYTYDVRSPENITRLARLPVVENEGIRSVRFDGPRAYAATANVSDPLFVLDLSDAAAPAVAGQLEILGISTHLIPLGDRLINFGIDNSFTYRRPSVTLFDVSDPRRPQPMSRIVLGSRGDRITSEANFDEKAVQVLPDEQLVLVPFSYYDDERFDWVDGVQIVDLRPARLAERGEVTHRGLVRRSGVADERLWILSDEGFKVSDIDDRDRPGDIAALEIISDQQLLDAGLWSCMDSARLRERDGDLPLEGPYGPWPILCGAGVPIAALALTLSLVGVRLSRRRAS